LGQDEGHTLTVDQLIRDNAQSGWRGNRMKERMLRKKLSEVLEGEEAIDLIIGIIRSHDEY
jgi:type I restriction enzyme R subunit